MIHRADFTFEAVRSTRTRGAETINASLSSLTEPVVSALDEWSSGEHALPLGCVPRDILKGDARDMSRAESSVTNAAVARCAPGSGCDVAACRNAPERVSGVTLGFRNSSLLLAVSPTESISTPLTVIPNAAPATDTETKAALICLMFIC